MHFLKPNKKKVIFSLVIALVYTAFKLYLLLFIFFSNQPILLPNLSLDVPSPDKPSFFDYVKIIELSIPVFLVSFLCAYFVFSIIEIIFSLLIHNRSKKD